MRLKPYYYSLEGSCCHAGLPYYLYPFILLDSGLRYC